jgi:glycosyltransferase involved in cell wall biosynthesis
LPRTPLVIANMPDYRVVPVRSTGQKLELLYHGLLSPGRGIEALIVAVGQLKRPVRLVLRGDGRRSYVDGLRRLAVRHALPEQVVFEPAVPPEVVIEAAARADIGLFTPPLPTPQARFMLPNKLFEYLMAGLMVIVSNADDVAEVVRRYQCGIVLADVSPRNLAAVIDALEAHEIRRFRGCAHESAHSLSWDNEQAKLIALYGELAETPARFSR